MGWRSRRDARGRNLIVVDTSAWVELLRATGSETHIALKNLIETEAELAVTEVIVAELLAGAKPATVQPLRARLLAFDLIPLEGLQDFERAAHLYRACRRAGEQIRSLIDCFIAIPALRHGATLLHNDSDFETMARHSDLKVRRS